MIYIKRKVDNMKSWQSIVGVLTAIAFIVGTAFAVDQHYAKQVEHQQLAQAFKEYVIQSNASTLRNKVWELEDQLRDERNPEVRKQIEQRIRELQAEQSKAQLDLIKIQQEQNPIGK